MQRHGESAERKLPDEIYVSLVRSLFGDPKTLIVGSAGTIGAAFITALKTWQPEFFVCAASMLAVALARAVDVRVFRLRTTPDMGVAEARSWEIRYVIGASAYVLLMGLWCFLAFAATSDPGVQLLCFSIMLANMIGVAGRNFGSKLLVAVQLVCTGVPMFLGLVWMGDGYYVMVGCVLAPFFLSFRTIADRLRLTLTSAVIAARDVQLLADRLDAALNNMAHGLCMLDRHGTITLTNKRLPEVLGIGLPGQPAGSVRALLRACKRAGILTASDFRKILTEAAMRLDSRNDLPLAVPLRDGRTLSLTIRTMDDRSAVVLVEDVTEQRNIELQIRHLAHYDSLTGLLNRTSFRKEMSRVLGDPDGACAIMFLDLDQFKQVNDTLGHPCGDELLKLVAERLRGLMRDSDMIARLGGDEFVIIHRAISRAEDVAALAGRIIEVVAHPYSIDGQQINIKTSIGIALAPSDSTDADQLLRYADLALYQAKSDGRGTYRFFEAAMGEVVEAQRALENDLRSALSNGELLIYYQPIIHLGRGTISGFEALLRWKHPTRGWVSPAEFIPLAEGTGIIGEIGGWVLRQACMEAASWPRGVNLAVNLSPHQFRNRTLVLEVLSALAHSGLAASRLELEITEAVLLQDAEATLATLRQLRELGVRTSMDDFGTGYSSLSYLHKFPFDKIKIDQSFVRDLPGSRNAVAIVKAAVGLGVHLGMTVTAEGVETEAQLAALRLEGCTEAQGYLFGRPQPASEVAALLVGGERRASA